MLPSTPAPLTIYFYVNSVPFTSAVLSGASSLGGSESACLTLAAALAARAHDVHIFATQLDLREDAPRVYHGVTWHGVDELASVLAFAPPDVFCALRDPSPFAMLIPAGLNLLWNQDLLQMPEQVSGALPQLDAMVYVSEFQRQQYTRVGGDLLAAMPSVVTRNSVDWSLVTPIREARPVRHPHRFIHISRPERGLAPLLAMWPRIRQQIPDAELRLCRYDSMYDAQGWGRICAQFDAEVVRVQQAVGGITWLGQLNKSDLYRELSQAACLLYPGIYDFAETSCLAVIEAQACGAIPIASNRGALAETLHPNAGLLVDGDATTAAYQSTFVEELVALTRDDLRQARMRRAGMAHAAQYDAAVVAAEWEAWILDQFAARYRANRVPVLRQLLHWDNHLHARLVAQDIVGSPAEPDTAQQEARHALALIDRVVKQEELDEVGYAAYAIPTEQEASISTRINQVADEIAAMDPPPATILDVACGNGAMLLSLARRLPHARLVGYDFSAGVLETARAALEAAGVLDRVELRHGGWDQVEGQAEVVFCGEFIEHVESPQTVIDRLQSHATRRVFVTTPCGPFAELLHYTIPRKRGHTHAYSARDIAQLFAHKASVAWRFLSQGVTPRGHGFGYWIIAWTPDGSGPAQPLDYWTTIQRTRPYRRIVAGLIVRDEEEWLRKCLLSIHPVVDDIVMVDTGSTDKTRDIAAEFGAQVFAIEWPHHFAAARNVALRLAEEQYGADWFLWIDADEHLDRPDAIRKYTLGRSPYKAYVIRQHHLMLDADRFYDVPCRLFRTGEGIQFYGVVHEQPELAPDQGIQPALDTPDLNIIHYGYETEPRRRGKLLTRNLGLLRREVASPRPRQMAWVLMVRELVTIAGYERADRPSQQTPDQAARAQHFLRSAIGIYKREGFGDPTHKFHDLIVGHYELALKWLGRGYEAEWSFAAAPGALAGHPRPQRLRDETPEAVERRITHKMQAWLRQLAPRDLHCEPWDGAPQSHVVAPAVVLAPTAAPE